jgi:hypothetical protein
MKKYTLFELIADAAKGYWWALLLVLIGFAVAYKFVAPPPPREITIATGSENGGYHRFGIQLKAALEKKGMKVTLRSTAGTIDNIKLLSDPQSGVTVAFGQGGAERYYDGDKEHIRGLGSLYYEPFWIFYRKDIGLTNFSGLKHMKVAIGKPGSGTRMLSETLLREDKIPENNWVPIGSTDAVKALKENQVQAVFLVAPVNDPIDKSKPHPDVYSLMADPNIALFGGTRAQAYVSRLPNLSIVTIGEGLIDLEKNYPPADAKLISPMGTLICREDLNGDIASLILTTCREIQEQGSWLEKPGEFPSKSGVTFPLLPEAKQFYEKGPSFFYKIFPFWVANMVNRLWIMAIPLITLVIPTIKLALPTYRWRMRRRIATKYRVLMAIDDKIVSGTIDQSLDADIAQLERYENELARMFVPIMFARDFYTLRYHVDFMRNKLQGIKAEKKKAPPPAA